MVSKLKQNFTVLLFNNVRKRVQKSNSFNQQQDNEKSSGKLHAGFGITYQPYIQWLQTTSSHGILLYAELCSAWSPNGDLVLFLRFVFVDSKMFFPHQCYFPICWFISKTVLQIVHKSLSRVWLELTLKKYIISNQVIFDFELDESKESVGNCNS